MTIIPAIDIIGGECVRLTQGDYSLKKVYFRDPVEVAKYFFDNGFKRLHIVDLDGAKSSVPVNLSKVEKIKSKTNMIVQFGGGLKSESSLKSAFDSGADYLICGSVAVKNPALFREWLLKFSGERLILGADIKEGKLSVTGWTEDTSLEIVPFVKGFLESGLKSVICTDISRDGMLNGPDFNLYESLRNDLPGVELTISGGVSSICDIEIACKRQFDAIIIGKAIYEKKIKIEELRKWLQNE